MDSNLILQQYGIKGLRFPSFAPNVKQQHESFGSNSSGTMKFIPKAGAIPIKRLDGSYGYQLQDMIPVGSQLLQSAPLFGAKYGFQGTITQPTLFLVGEGRYPERVNIIPMQNIYRGTSKIFNQIKKSK